MKIPQAALVAACFGILLSGCLGGGEIALNPADGTDEPASSVVVEPEPGVKVAENRGALRGYVRDEANLTVGDARVSLLNTDHFADTDKGGEFLFVNLTAGEYEIFVQAQGFESANVIALVSNAAVTTVYVFLAPPVDSDLGGRAHLHDFWGDRTEVTLMDAAVDLLSADANGGAFYSGAYASTVLANGNSSDRYKFWIQGNGQDPPIVFPGTRELVVTFSWTSSQASFKKLGLAYNTSGGAFSGVPRYLPVQPSGASWVIPVGPTMADDGHRAFSKWKFWVHSPSLSAASASADGPPGVITGPIQVKMILRKGDVRPEPAHPDFWQGASSVVVLDKHTCIITQTASYTSGNREAGSYHCLIQQAGKLVPPGTTRLRIAFWWKYGGTASNAVSNGSAADRDYVLTWFTANQHPIYTKLADYGRAAPVYEDVAGHHKVYEVKLKPEETDRFYDRLTGWGFLPSVKGDENDPEFREFGRERTYTISLTAYRDAPE